MARNDDQCGDVPGPLPSKRTKTDQGCESRTSRSKATKINWSLCMFCQKIKHKGVKTLINVSSFDACKSIVAAAEARAYLDFITNIRELDLIAVEAKYHSACRASYVSKSNLKRQTFKDEDEKEECIYEKSFKELLTEIDNEITAGKAFEMTFLLERYKEKLSLNGVPSPAYRSEKLKKRLSNYFGNSIVFHKPPDPSKPELIYSSSISVKSLINAAVSTAKADDYLSCSYSPEEKDDAEAEKLKVLFEAAQILKEDIKKSKGICIRPLSVDDITLERGRSVVPDSLYHFLQWFVSQQEYHESDKPAATCKSQEDERRILMLGQDMVHTSTRTRLKTPKHVGLGITIHHLTGSKQLITLLNKMGHCCSYNDVEIINTGLAREISARSEQLGVIVPSNLSPGVFLQFAADNNDLNEETLDGKRTTHATTIVGYQRKAFGPKLPLQSKADHSSKRRSLEAPLSSQAIHDFGVRSRRPAVTSYRGKLKESGNFSKDAPNIDNRDFAWFLLRLNKNSALLSTSDDITEDKQTTPSWSAFNAITSVAVTAPCTNIGYCPMIPGPATEYSTIYTVMKAVQDMSVSLGQTNSVVTFDLAIYTKAKEIQWRRPDEFQNLTIPMGGFHIALNFLSVIGKKFEESGIEDLLVESGLYGTSSTLALLKGKSYNRGVRAHKLIMEALLRLQWRAFCRWLEKKKDEQQLETINVDQVQMNMTQYKNKVATDAVQAKDAFDDLCKSVDDLYHLFQRFKVESRSQMFKFWDSYINMVFVLLRFIKAEREANWELHLQSTAEMLPHFFSMDRTNYSRWFPVHLADMLQLGKTAPEVHREFLEGNHAVSRSQQPFSQIWTDMALEQSVNRDSKTKGGIVGISQKEGALEKWFLTAHERAAVTTTTKEMCGVRTDGTMSVHKERDSLRMKRDEDDVKKLVSTLESVMVNPFEGHDTTLPLSNLATGVVMPTDMASSAEKIGATEMNSFVSKRLNTNTVGFWDTLPKIKIQTFASLTKKVQARASDEKIITINADRSLFARLLVASNTRNIDLREVLKYELSSVPCALAHPDGTLRKSNKSVLLSVLEGFVDVLPRLPHDDEEPITAKIIDGMALVQMTKTAGARTFGEMADRYFKKITGNLGIDNCSRVDVVFDRYDKTDSIKESERIRRGSASGYEIKITGPSTPVPKNWNAYIANPVNKMNLQHFLSETWTKMGKKSLMFGHQLVFAGCFANPQDVLIVESGTARSLHQLVSDQEEADTRMMLHAEDCSLQHRRIVVHSPDTDVLVLATYVFSSLSCDEMWMRTGVKDKLRFIPIHTLKQKLGSLLCSLLPTFHALTGCDTTSGPYFIGKKKAWKVLTDHQDKFAALTNFGEGTPLSPDLSAAAEQYLCSIYSTAPRAGITANDVR